MLTLEQIRVRTLTLYEATVKQFAALVQNLPNYNWPKEAQVVRMQRAAIGTLIIHALRLSKAVLALLNADLGQQILTFVRGQFEMAVKLSYIEKHPKRGGDFLLLEPFERYWLAKDYNIPVARLATIVSDCKTVVANNPGLVKYQSGGRAAQRPDFLAIREHLSFPSIREMLLELGWNMDLYVTVFLFGSLDTHGSINQLRNYVQDIDTNTPSLIVEEAASWPPDYALQSLAYVFGTMGAIGRWFHISDEETQKIAALFAEYHSLSDGLSSLDGTAATQKRVKRQRYPKP